MGSVDLVQFYVTLTLHGLRGQNGAKLFCVEDGG